MKENMQVYWFFGKLSDELPFQGKSQGAGLLISPSAGNCGYNYLKLLPGIKRPEIWVKRGVAHPFSPKFPGVFPNSGNLG